MCYSANSPARSGSLSLCEAPVIVGRLLLWREQKMQYEIYVSSQQQQDVSKVQLSVFMYLVCSWDVCNDDVCLCVSFVFTVFHWGSSKHYRWPRITVPSGIHVVPNTVGHKLSTHTYTKTTGLIKKKGKKKTLKTKIKRLTSSKRERVNLSGQSALHQSGQKLNWTSKWLASERIISVDDSTHRDVSKILSLPAHEWKNEGKPKLWHWQEF